MLFKLTNFLSLVLHIQYMSSLIKNIFYILHCFTKKSNFSPRFYRAHLQLIKFSKLEIFHTPGKNLSDVDMLSRSFTKAEFQLNQLKHKQLPPHYHIKNMTLIQFLLLMVEINFQYDSMIKETILMSILYILFHLNL